MSDAVWMTLIIVGGVVAALWIIGQYNNGDDR